MPVRTIYGKGVFPPRLQARLLLRWISHHLHDKHRNPYRHEPNRAMFKCPNSAKLLSKSTLPKRNQYKARQKLQGLRFACLWPCVETTQDVTLRR
eukprot:5043943-Amphidinium_carterae.1